MFVMRLKRQVLLRHNNTYQVNVIALLLILALFGSPRISFAADGFLVIPLKHRPADVIVTQLAPHLGAGTSASASANSVILRGEGNELTQIRLLIETLDQPLAQYVIHVRHQQGANGSSSGLRVNGAIVTNSNSQSRYNGTQINTRVYTHSTQSMDNNDYQVRATEGYSAYISTGDQIPIESQSQSIYGNQTSVQYQPAMSGVYVTPLSSGENRVQLTLSTEKTRIGGNSPHTRYNNSPPTLDSTVYSGVIEANLGEWINIGGVNLSQMSDSGYQVSTRSINNQNIEVMVTLSPQ